VACQGGKRLGQIGEEGRLILIDWQEVITLPPHDLLTLLALGQQGIAGHQPPDQGHLVQEHARRRQFLAFPDRPNLSEHGLRLVGVGTHQMDAGNLISVNPPQGLAIDRDRVIGRHPGLTKPVPDDPLKGRDIEPFEHPMQRCPTRAASSGKPQSVQQRGIVFAPFTPPLGHGIEAPRPAQDRRDRQLEERDQGKRGILRTPAIGLARIRHGCQGCRQGAGWGRWADRQRLTFPHLLLQPLKKPDPLFYSPLRLMK
jgi:hypothetical protein